MPLTHTLWSVSDRARHTRCGRSPTEPPRANLDGRAGAVRRPARARHTRCGRSPTEPPRANLDGRASAVRRPARARHTRCGRSPTEPPAGLWLVARARSGDRPEPDTRCGRSLTEPPLANLDGRAGAVKDRPERHTRCGRSPTEPDIHAAAGLRPSRRRDFGLWRGRGQETGPSDTCAAAGL